MFSVQIRYVEEARPMITGMRRISKPGRRVYVGRDDVPRFETESVWRLFRPRKGS